jgi:hypothetical protein
VEKVKLFSRGFAASGEDDSRKSLEVLEGQVNTFLAQNNIEVTARQMSIASGVNIQEVPFMNCTVAIFYRETTK